MTPTVKLTLSHNMVCAFSGTHYSRKTVETLPLGEALAQLAAFVGESPAQVEPLYEEVEGETFGRGLVLCGEGFSVVLEKAEEGE